MTDDDDKEIRLGVNLNEEATQKFLEIKKYLGIESNADIVRWLINWYHERMESRRE